MRHLHVFWSLGAVLAVGYVGLDAALEVLPEALARGAASDIHHLFREYEPWLLAWPLAAALLAYVVRPRGATAIPLGNERALAGWLVAQLSLYLLGLGARAIVSPVPSTMSFAGLVASHIASAWLPESSRQDSRSRARDGFYRSGRVCLLLGWRWVSGCWRCLRGHRCARGRSSSASSHPS